MRATRSRRHSFGIWARGRSRTTRGAIWPDNASNRRSWTRLIGAPSSTSSASLTLVSHSCNAAHSQRKAPLASELNLLAAVIMIQRNYRRRKAQQQLRMQKQGHPWSLSDLLLIPIMTKQTVLIMAKQAARGTQETSFNMIYGFADTRYGKLRPSRWKGFYSSPQGNCFRT